MTTTPRWHQGNRVPRRHVLRNGICWCGSTHDWERAKDGCCECRTPKCRRVHNDGGEK